MTPAGIGAGAAGCGRSGAAVALTIAGSDSGGGAGIQADLKTFEAFGVWGTSAITAVTAQSTVGVRDVLVLPAPLVRAQIDAVAVDLAPAAAKTGMLGSAEVVEAVARSVEEHRLSLLVVDPVLVSSLGEPLLAEDAVRALREVLLPLATVLTPNLPEAEVLLGTSIAGVKDFAPAAEALAALGPAAVLLKGGHLGGDRSPDLLWRDGEVEWLDAPRIPGRHTHGTGCTLSAAICALLAGGRELGEACAEAKRFVAGAIAGGLDIGRGAGPVNPGWGRRA
ncbi:MAG: bifunctional hydroxymethylpyrimidine kinase/phosphomethylpyrimidine kinase [Acidimicrobiales bacterium]